MSSLTSRPAVDFTVDRALIERELEELVAGPELGPVREAMRYAVFSGGHRIRPLLALKVARLTGGSAREASVAAAAVEMLHCASLIIDDLPCMDDEASRRGNPCTHVRFGEATAILAAFGLVALAARQVVHLPRFQKTLLGVLDCNALIAGQALDLTELKTVPLFELAVQAGGAASPEFGDVEHTLMRFAREFGLAFQLTDDFIDGDLGDPAVALNQLEVARTLALGLGDRAHELNELIDFLHGRIWQTNYGNR